MFANALTDPAASKIDAKSSLFIIPASLSALIASCRKPPVRCAEGSSDFLTASPPGEKTPARQDQTGQSSTHNRPWHRRSGDGRSLRRTLCKSQIVLKTSHIARAGSKWDVEGGRKIARKWSKRCLIATGGGHG